MPKLLISILIVALLALGLWYFNEIRTANAVPEVTQSSEQPVLPEDDRQFLWNAEHNGLELGKYGWNPLLKEGLASANRERLQEVLAEDFSGSWSIDSLADNPKGLSLTDSKNTENLKSLTSTEFIDELLRCRSLFGEDLSTHFKLLAVYPVDRDYQSGAWMGRGRITLKGRSVDGARLSCQLHLKYETVYPGRLNLEAGQWLKSCEVFRENTVETDQALFVDVTEHVGLDWSRLHDNWQAKKPEVNTGGVYLCDYNLDGCTDMLVTDSQDFAGLMMYRGSPNGQFEDVTIELGLPRVPNTIDAIFADFDNDGWEDLILPGRKVLRNIKGLRFEDVTERSNLNSLVLAVGGQKGWISISGASVVDYDADGLVDLYVTRADAIDFKNGSWIDGKSGQTFGNQLLRNKGNFEFEDVTAATQTTGDFRSTFTSVWLDANNDTWPDVYVINEFGSGLLLLNESGQRFQAVELDDQSADFASMGLTSGDFNNDDHIDLYVSNMFSSAGNRVMDNLPAGHYDDDTMYKLRRMVSGNQLHLNNGNLQFQGAAADYDVAQVGWGWGPAAADFNNDGWLDLYATCGFMSHTRAKPDG